MNTGPKELETGIIEYEPEEGIGFKSPGSPAGSVSDIAGEPGVEGGQLQPQLARRSIYQLRTYVRCDGHWGGSVGDHGPETASTVLPPLVE